MEFLSCYVRNVHADRYLKNLLLNNPGYTYLDIITPSDIAYVISLIKNSAHLWLLKKFDAHDDKDSEALAMKPIFTAGLNTKRTFGITTWNKDGIEYYNNALKNWERAFIKTNPQYIILQTYWDKWINDKDKGKKLMVGNYVGMKKSVHSILATREVGEKDKRRGRSARENEDLDEDDEFDYESDPEDGRIDFGNWKGTAEIGGGGTLGKVQMKKYRSSSNEDEDDDEDEDDEDINKDEYGDNKKSDEEDSFCDDESIKSQSVLQKQFEDVASSEGMGGSGRRKNSKKRM